MARLRKRVYEELLSATEVRYRQASAFCFLQRFRSHNQNRDLESDENTLSINSIDHLCRRLVFSGSETGTPLPPPFFTGEIVPRFKACLVKLT